MSSKQSSATHQCQPAKADLAQHLHQRSIVIDTHVDTVLRTVDLGHDLARAGSEGYMDLPGMMAGNLTAAFFACCVEAAHVRGGTAAQRLEQLLAGVEAFCEANRQTIKLARSASEIRKTYESGMRAAILCVEGGQAIGRNLDQLESLHQRGVAYLSLTHFTSNPWADSSTDVPLHDGLSALGREVVQEMNRLGLMVDVSHASDKAFWDVLEISKQPVMASHSSARALTDHPRNLTDDMVAALASKDGLIGVTWWPEYISERYARDLERHAANLHGVQGNRSPETRPTSGIATLLEALGDDDAAKYRVLVHAGVPFPSLEDVLDHIEHVLAVAGEDHVCVGTDHGAVNFRLHGLEHCSELGALTEALVARGHCERVVRKMLGENVLSFMDRVQRQ